MTATFPLTRRSLSWWMRWHYVTGRLRASVERAWGLHPDEIAGLSMLESSLAAAPPVDEWFELGAGWSSRVCPGLLDQLLAGLTYTPDLIPELVRILLPEKLLGAGAPLAGRTYLEDALKQRSKGEDDVAKVSQSTQERVQVFLMRRGLDFAKTVDMPTYREMAEQLGMGLGTVQAAVCALRKAHGVPRLPAGKAAQSDAIGPGPEGDPVEDVIHLDLPVSFSAEDLIAANDPNTELSLPPEPDPLTLADRLHLTQEQLRLMTAERDRLETVKRDRDGLADRVHALGAQLALMTAERDEWQRRAEFAVEASRPEAVGVEPLDHYHAAHALWLSTGDPSPQFRDIHVLQRAAVLERAAALVRLALS